jgi:methionyl-tRNA synthetase
MPESKDADFTWNEFQRRNNEELVSTFGNFAHRVLMFIDRFHDGIIPESNDLDELDRSVLHQKNLAVDGVGAYIQRCEFKKAMARIMNLASVGNQYFNEKAPWKNKGDSCLYVSACMLRTLSILIAPFLPFSAQKLWNMLGYKSSVHEQEWKSAKKNIKSQSIYKIQPLFKIIEDVGIEEQKAKLGKK